MILFPISHNVLVMRYRLFNLTVNLAGLKVLVLVLNTPE